MTRAERVRRKASRLENLGIKRSILSTRSNPIGRGAIRAGQLAAKAYRLSKQLFQYALDLEAAAEREKKSRKKKLPRDWCK